jgi:hypothetical protein
MVAPSSRYGTLGEATYTSPDGHVAVYLRRRLLPDPELARGGVTTVRPNERRADLLAARTLGSVGQFYRLCDANAIADPFDLTDESVAQVYLPRQAGMPGAPGGSG